MYSTYVCGRQQYEARKIYSIYYPTLELALWMHQGAGRRRVRPATVSQTNLKVTLTHLGDAKPDVFVPLRVAEAKLEFRGFVGVEVERCLLYTSPSPRDQRGSRMPSSA